MWPGQGNRGGRLTEHSASSRPAPCFLTALTPGARATQQRWEQGHETTNALSPSCNPESTRALMWRKSAAAPAQSSTTLRRSMGTLWTPHWGGESQTWTLPEPCDHDTVRSVVPPLAEPAQPAPRTPLLLVPIPTSTPAASLLACRAHLSAPPCTQPRPALPFQQWLWNLLNCGSVETKTHSKQKDHRPSCLSCWHWSMSR